MERRVQILTQTEVKRALMRLSYEIIEKSEDLDKVVLAGIHTRGIPISEILRDNIEKNTGKQVEISITANETGQPFGEVYADLEELIQMDIVVEEDSEGGF